MAAALEAAIEQGGEAAFQCWLKFACTELGEEDSEANWFLLVATDRDRPQGHTLEQRWCGHWLESRSCRRRALCKYAHPAVHLRFCCEGKTVPLTPTPPLKRVSLEQLPEVNSQDVLFLEQRAVGIVWGRSFTAQKNRWLLCCFLRSAPGQEAPQRTLAHFLGRRRRIQEMRILPDECWHRIACAAGLRTTAKLCWALGAGVNWTPWLPALVQRSPSDDAQSMAAPGSGSISSIADGGDHEAARLPTNYINSYNRCQCWECFKWSALETKEQCRRCSAWLCEEGCQPVHRCRRLQQDTGVVAESSESASNSRDDICSFIGSALQCAALASALRHPRVSQRSARSQAQYPVDCTVHDAVQDCLAEPRGAEQHRLLHYDQPVLAALCTEESLLVRTSKSLRLTRLSDWASFPINVPAPTTAEKADFDLIDGDAKLVSISSSRSHRGLLVTSLEDSTSTIVRTRGLEAALQATSTGLLVSETEALVLHDWSFDDGLRPVAEWACEPLWLGRDGALAMVGGGGSGGHSDSVAQSPALSWVDLRQRAVVNLGLSEAHMRRLTTATRKPNEEHLIVLGDEAGTITALDRRRPALPLWCVGGRQLFAPACAASSLPVGGYKLQAADRMVTQRIRGADGVDYLTALTWEGNLLGRFHGVDFVAKKREGDDAIISHAPIAFGIGGSLVVIGPQAGTRELVARPGSLTKEPLQAEAKRHARQRPARQQTIARRGGRQAVGGRSR
eukprot:TRINITY_DN24370_c0_g1_i1.p1 TRINITY_DN24370_c0_g1~~TRINITY_DN24370_c0_g1_i1.p1  ORF type:complete len:765 (-),score=71.31 TRINITY_DN24370_c0_g1_i1:194-2395(-)